MPRLCTDQGQAASPCLPAGGDHRRHLRHSPLPELTTARGRRHLIRLFDPPIGDPLALLPRVPQASELTMTERTYVEDLIDQEDDFDRWYVEVVKRQSWPTMRQSAAVR